ncbi:MAG: DUF2726 domain-containing protein [Patescibacteria group bacterium]
MNKLIVLALIVFVLGFIFKLLAQKNDLGKSAKKEEWLPYMKKSYLLTRAEHEFFVILEKAVEGQYYIFPQLALDKIVLLSGKGSLKSGYRNKIDLKSVDFVLFDKQNISPILVIELDDPSHEKPERQLRDGFVDRVLNHCGIPILHVTSTPNEDNLRAQITQRVKIV